MKIISQIILISILSFGLFSGCQKASINGHLDGRWQIMEVEENGEVSNEKDLQLYYNFNLHVVSLSTYGFYYKDGNFLYEGNSILMDFPYYQNEAGERVLQKFYIYSNPVEFTVEYLSKDKLILKEGDLLITLRKF